MSYTITVRGVQVACATAEDTAKLVKMLDDGAERARVYLEGGIAALEQLKHRVIEETAELMKQNAQAKAVAQCSECNGEEE